MRGLNYLSFILAVLLLSTLSYAQLDSVWHQGPSPGSISGGAMQTTDNFTDELVGIKEGFRVIPLIKRDEQDFGEMIIPVDESQLPPYLYIEDETVTSNASGNGGQTILLNSFPMVGKLYCLIVFQE